MEWGAGWASGSMAVAAEVRLGTRRLGRWPVVNRRRVVVVEGGGRALGWLRRTGP
jgi:hypothetical protein